VNEYRQRSNQERFNRKSLQQVYDTGLYNAGRDTGCSRPPPQQRANSLSPAQNGCHYARTAATMQHGEHQKRLFVWCVGDDVAAYGLEPQGFVVRSGLLCPWCGNGTSLRTASRMSSRTRRAAKGLSSRINSKCR
jgi:hypothetical protein